MLLKRILITGANGLLGQELVQQLASNNYCDVLATGLDTHSRQIADVSFSYTPMDICNAEDSRHLIEDFAPDWVINCAALTQVDRCQKEQEHCWHINVQGVENLARACHAIGARLIQISTDFIFDGALNLYQETARPNPINFYGRSKLAGENAARKVGIDKWAIVRTSVIYGAGVNLTRKDFVGWVRHNLEASRSINVFTDQWRTPTYSYDLAKGIDQLIRLKKSGVYNISGRDYMSMYTFAQAIADVFCLDQSLIRSATQATFKQDAPRPSQSGLLTLKAETEIGYYPLNIREALCHLKQRLTL